MKIFYEAEVLNNYI